MIPDPVMRMLRIARKAQGLSQRELAEMVGIQQSAISEWETGTTSPQLDSVRRVAAALGADLYVDLPMREKP